ARDADLHRALCRRYRSARALGDYRYIRFAARGAIQHVSAGLQRRSRRRHSDAQRADLGHGGTVLARVRTRAHQRVAPPAAVADPFTLAQNVVPIAGTLTIGNASLTDNTPFATDVRITEDDVALAASLDTLTTLPAKRTKTTWLDATLLNNAGLGGVSVATK